MRSTSLLVLSLVNHYAYHRFLLLALQQSHLEQLLGSLASCSASLTGFR
jgi:hypothetical protein